MKTRKNDNYSISTIIAAGGKSSRMNGTNKLTSILLDSPVIVHTLKAFIQIPKMSEIIVVIPQEDMDLYEGIFKSFQLLDQVRLVSGGHNRRISVLNGLKALEDKKGIVLIHDGARPLVNARTIYDCIEGAKRYGACVAAYLSVDTVKKADNIMFVEKTLDRDKIYFAQTPQAFKTEIILDLHKKAEKDLLEVTDDAMICEHYGHNIKIIPSDRWNIKITREEDLILARALLSCGD